MDPLRLLEWRLNLRNWRKLLSWSVSRPLSCKRGRRSSRTRPSKQAMPFQSQGADGVEGCQPSMAPSGSSRLCLKDSKARISVALSAHVKVKAVADKNTKTAVKCIKIGVTVDMRVMKGL